MSNSDLFWQLFFWLSTATALLVIFWVHRAAWNSIRQADLSRDKACAPPNPQHEETK